MGNVPGGPPGGGKGGPGDKKKKKKFEPRPPTRVGKKKRSKGMQTASKLPVGESVTAARDIHLLHLECYRTKLCSQQSSQTNTP
jgi:26S proteasome regulatory subunit T2